MGALHKINEGSFLEVAIGALYAREVILEVGCMLEEARHRLGSRDAIPERQKNELTTIPITVHLDAALQLPHPAEWGRCLVESIAPDNSDLETTKRLMINFSYC